MADNYYSPAELARADALSARIANQPPETSALAQALLAVFDAGKTLGASIATTKEQGT